VAACCVAPTIVTLKSTLDRLKASRAVPQSLGKRGIIRPFRIVVGPETSADTRAVAEKMALEIVKPLSITAWQQNGQCTTLKQMPQKWWTVAPYCVWDSAERPHSISPEEE